MVNLETPYSIGRDVLKAYRGTSVFYRGRFGLLFHDGNGVLQVGGENIERGEVIYLPVKGSKVLYRPYNIL